MNEQREVLLNEATQEAFSLHQASGPPRTFETNIWKDIHLTNSMKSYWKERQSVVEELNRKVTFLWSYGQTTVVISGNNGSAPLIGSEDNQDRASDGSVWSEKEPRIHGPMRPNARCEDCEEENRLSLCDICVKLWNRFIWLFVTAQQQLSIPEEVCSEDDIAYHSQSHTSANHIPQPITYLSQSHTSAKHIPAAGDVWWSVDSADGPHVVLAVTQFIGHLVTPEAMTVTLTPVKGPVTAILRHS